MTVAVPTEGVARAVSEKLPPATASPAAATSLRGSETTAHSKGQLTPAPTVQGANVRVMRPEIAPEENRDEITHTKANVEVGDGSDLTAFMTAGRAVIPRKHYQSIIVEFYIT